MPIDFSKIGTSNAVDMATDPTEVFSALPGRKETHPYLRDVQGAVLRKWSGRRAERDVVIKMNTGTGKTTVGLLILKASLNEKKGPALYLSPNNQLASQVAAEASELGLPVTDDPRSADYRAGRAIAVVTTHRLFNGRSIFGVGATPDIPIGTVLMDDAHASMDITEQQFSLQIPREHAAYGKLFDLFADDIKNQSYKAFLDIKKEDPVGLSAVPFWAWLQKMEQVTEILHGHREDTLDFQLRWPLLGDSLKACSCVFTGANVEIRPACPPVHRIPAFAQAERRIYLTATLADDSSLVLQFDADPDSIMPPITPDTASDFGDRLILAPQEIDHSITSDALKGLVAELAESHNVLTIVPSYAQMENWYDLDPTTVTRDNIDDVISDLKAGYCGLVLAANRYDGIDLPGSACRVVAVAGLPQATTPTERWSDSILAGSRLRKTRQVQRLEQGMGRAVRSSTDYCVVLLVGGHVSEWVNDATTLELFSPTTWAQLDLSRHIASQVSGQGLEGVREAIQTCLGVDEEWRAASRNVLSQVGYDALGHVPEQAPAFRKAFNYAELDDWQNAAESAQRAVAAATDLHEKGWYKLWLAHYTHPIGSANAQDILKSGRKENRALPKPLHGITYQKLSSEPRHQGLRLSQLIASLYASSAEMSLSIRAILDDLQWDPDKSKRFEEAMKQLGRHVGFEAQRPDQETGHGPDVLWAVGDLEYWLFECKSGAQSSTVAKKDLNQLSGHRDWFRGHYDQSCTAVPVMVHPGNVLGGPSPEGMRRIGTESLKELRSAVERCWVELAQPENHVDPKAIYRSLSSHGLDKADFLKKFTTSVKS
jgi:hypothetical protein